MCGVGSFPRLITRLETWNLTNWFCQPMLHWVRESQVIGMTNKLTSISVWHVSKSAKSKYVIIITSQNKWKTLFCMLQLRKDIYRCHKRYLHFHLVSNVFHSCMQLRDSKQKPRHQLHNNKKGVPQLTCHPQHVVNHSNELETADPIRKSAKTSVEILALYPPPPLFGIWSKTRGVKR